MPSPEVSLRSTFFLKRSTRLVNGICFASSTPSSAIFRISFADNEPLLICVDKPDIILFAVIPLIIFWASSSGILSCFWTSLSFSARAAVKPWLSLNICSACALNALSDKPLCTSPISIMFNPKISPNCCKRVNSDWSRSIVMRTPIGALTWSPCMQNMR